MLNRIGCALVIFVVAWLSSYTLGAQTIVSTSPSSKRAVLEEFGGMYCVYCPHGHEIIADLKEGLGDNLVLLNYQNGPYADPIGNDPDLGNDYGEALIEHSQLTGYPAATVNRQVFSGLEQGVPGSTAMGRSSWTEAVTEVLQQSAPVNIAAEATLNISTRELEVYLEYYYTDNVDFPDNHLHVAVLQNNVIAPQHGSSAGNYYLHQHLFREFLTGANGHIITNTDEGSYGALTYSVQLPEFYRDVWTDPVNIELAIFITEDEQEVLNGIEVVPDLVSDHSSDVQLLAIMAPDDVCDPLLNAAIVFRNDGNESLTGCTVTYGIEGSLSYTTDWTGSLSPLESTTLTLDGAVFPEQTGQNIFHVSLQQPNGSDDPTFYNNEREHDFSLAPRVSDPVVELVLRTDDFGYETYWEIVDEEETVIASGGNQVVRETNGGAQVATSSDEGALDNNAIVIEEIFLPFSGCYSIRLYDDYGDGICCNYGEGFYRIRQYGEVLLEGGEFGAYDEQQFTVGGLTSGSDQAVVEADAPRLFPNPVGVGQSFQLEWNANPPLKFTWQLFAANGALIEAGNQSQMPGTGSYPVGYYVFRLQTSEEIYNLPIVVQ